MKYTFSLDESDLLTHQLFLVSTSKAAIWRRRRSWIIIVLTFIVCSGLFYIESNAFLRNYFVLLAFISLIFYPLYSRWKYKRHYLRHIREHFSGTTGKQATIEFQEEFIFESDETNSESKINYSTIESLNELPNHFIIRLKTGQALVLPKNKIENIDQLHSDLLELTKRLGVELKNHKNWKWR
ncbi:hypothetical protein C9994_12420 [Marivirga lumbricoides]|uniref:YcxB-like C-terminal domain-containing protein n=1 Tax=Marivirga lumbricoides TaxID=1046115 RepID=A0A2T4DJT8_9BACT|nr:hypothetical protein C9994_12420 [Marivirga lumbricoides]